MALLNPVPPQTVPTHRLLPIPPTPVLRALSSASGSPAVKYGHPRRIVSIARTGLQVSRASSPGPSPHSPAGPRPCSCAAAHGRSRTSPAAQSSSSPLVQRPQPRALYLVLALDLLHHQLRVRHHPQPPVAVAERVVQRRQQPRILGEIVRLDPQKLRQARPAPAPPHPGSGPQNRPARDCPAPRHRNGPKSRNPRRKETEAKETSCQWLIQGSKTFDKHKLSSLLRAHAFHRPN